MTKSDAEVIKMLLWLILRTLSTNPLAESLAAFCVGIHAIAAIVSAIAEVGK